jgi:ribosomal protein S18 acetylase RimI-like enzyme
MGKIKIEVLEDNFPYEEITELLHASYREHLEAGRKYLAATQTVEDTKRRLDGRICIVCYDGEGKLVGTLAAKIIKKGPDSKRKWYEDDNYFYIEQMAVHPDYRDANIMSMMALRAMKNKEVRKADSWMSDTSMLATELVRSYVGLGFQIVDMVSWESTNYYSYVFRKAVSGKVYSDKYVKFRFFLSKLACQLRYTAEGKKRF